MSVRHLREVYTQQLNMEPRKDDGHDNNGNTYWDFNSRSGNILSILYILTNFILPITLEGGHYYYYSHFIEDEINTQSSSITCLRR